jgi:acyl-CoA thioesterase FadM
VPRRTHFAFASDTCLFSPVQMQPASVLRAGMTALASCIGHQLTEWRALKRDHRVTVVIVGVKLTYLRDFDFFAACHIDVDAGLTVRSGGRFLELGCVLGPADDPFAVLTVLNKPVALSGTEALDATPCSLDPALLSRFHADERDDSPIIRPVIDATKALEEGGELIGQGTMPFTVSRADCEIADQWQNVRLPDWLSAGRERIVFATADPRVKAGLRAPMRHLYAEYRRPMYLGDEGILATHTYATAGTVSFVHQIHAATSGAPAGVCAVAVEEFATGEQS